MRLAFVIPLAALAGCADGTQERVGRLDNEPATVSVDLALNTVAKKSRVSIAGKRTTCTAVFVAPYAQQSSPVVATCADGRSGSGMFTHSKPLGTFEVSFALNDGATGFARF